MPRTKVRHVSVVAGAALAVPLVVAPVAAAAPATVHSTLYGIEAPSVTTASGRAVAVWGGETGGRRVLASEHEPDDATWTGPTTVADAGGSVVETDVAGNARGDAVAVWVTVAHGVGDPSVVVTAARRLGPGRWSAPVALASHPDTGFAVPTLLPSRLADLEVAPDGAAIAVVGAPDGSVVARRLAPGAEEWDPPHVLRPPHAPPSRVPQVALAVDGRGEATALWWDGGGDERRRLAVARLRGATWSVPETLPGSEGAYYPAVVDAGGQTSAAFTRDGGVWALARRADGNWTRPERVGDGYAPRLHGGPRLTAATWSGTPGLALRGAGDARWSASRSPVPPVRAAVARDGSLLVAGRTRAGVVAWARRDARGRWSAPRLVSRPRDVPAATPVALVPARHVLGTLVWDGSVLPGRLRMPRGGAVLQAVDLHAGTGVATTSNPRLLLREAPSAAPAGALIRLRPTFVRYTGRVRVQVQVVRGGRWRGVETTHADIGDPVAFRLLRPVRTRVRLAYGPGLRRVTGAVPLRVTRPARARVVAGWSPVALAAHGDALWVLGYVRRGGQELRLLDARTGRVRRGPVPVGESAYLVDAGTRVLLWSPASNAYRVLDPSLPRLTGPPATVEVGTCDPVCRPARIQVGETSSPIGRSGPSLSASPVTGPDGRLWTLRPGATDEAGTTSGSLLEGRPGAAPEDRGDAGIVSAHGGPTPELLAVAGGAWVMDVRGQVRWFGSGQPGVRKTVAATLGGRGACVWALADVSSGSPRLMRLRPGKGPDGPAVPLGAAVPADAPVLAVGPRVAWTIAWAEQALVRVPLPRC